MTAGALQERPTASVLFERAVSAHLSGKPEEAERGYAEVLRIDGTHAPSCNNLGALLARAGRLDDAESLFRRAVALNPDYGEAHNNIGLLHVDRGDFAGAADAFATATSLERSNAAWQNNLGNALVECFRFGEAVAAYDRAVAAEPGNADYWSNRSLALRGLRKNEIALDSLSRALEIDPQHVNALSNLGVVLKEERRYGEAVNTLERAIALAPGNVALRTNLAAVFERTGESAMVRRWAQSAVDADANYPESYNLLANMEMEDGRYDAALALYHKVIELDPANRNANWNIALLLLLRGDFENGWKQFEWRKRLHSVVFDHGDYGPGEWSGDSLNGRSILLHSEQGIGDAIQFIRYAQLLKKCGAGTVVVECPWPIAPLLAGVPGVDSVVARGALLPSYDVHANLMSLPGLMGTTATTVPTGVPYIPVEPRPIDALLTETRGARGNKPVVAVCWTGNPGHARDFLRSTSLAPFIDLARSVDATFVSVQKGESAEAGLRAAGDCGVTDLAPQLGDFRDTASVLAAVDLVITVDTSIAHLAGALGRPVWVLLPHVPDFRWMLDRNDSPWYPTMRLFRQPRPRDWAPVFESVRAELAEFVALAAAFRERPRPMGDVVTIESARRFPDGRPRFDLWLPLAGLARPAWFEAWRAETLGEGYEAGLRQFVDELPRRPFRWLDTSPGIGISTLDVATGETRPESIVIVEPDPDNATRIVTTITNRAPTLEVSSCRTLAAAIASDTGDARLLVRVGHDSHTQAVVHSIASGHFDPAVVFWTDTLSDSSRANLDSLTALGFVTVALRCVDGEAVLDPFDGIDSPIAASIRAELLDELSGSEARPPSISPHAASINRAGVSGVEVLSLPTTSIIATRPQTGRNSRRQLGIDWELRGDTGWGVFGLNLVAALRRLGEVEPVVYQADLTALDPLTLRALDTVLRDLSERSAVFSGATEHRGLMLRALGNGLQRGQLSGTIRAPASAGFVFVEDTAIDRGALERISDLGALIAGSTWNSQLLTAAGVANVATVLQGVDTSIFHPAPGRGLPGSPFVVFSGGKLEFRKGQDLVLAAFLRFHQRHPDSILVTAWHNRWPQLVRDMERAGHVPPVPTGVGGAPDIAAWARAAGLPSEAFIDLGPQPNSLMAQYIREAQVAILPSRAEGGTNLVAMECMASGVPTVVSANTGHLDLIATGGCISLDRQRAVCGPVSFFKGTDGWGESDVDEIVDALEGVHSGRVDTGAIAARGAAAMSRLSWTAQVGQLLASLAPLWP